MNFHPNVCNRVSVPSYSLCIPHTHTLTLLPQRKKNEGKRGCPNQLPLAYWYSHTETMVNEYHIIFFTIITGKDTSPTLSSTIKSEKFTLVPSPDPIMSHKEYIHVLPLPKGHISACNSAACLQSPHSMDTTETDAAVEVAATGACVPSGQKKVDYRSEVSVNGEVIIVLESNSKKSESLKKRVRFARCSKDMKYLCAVCSKPDCMKCSNCL